MAKNTARNAQPRLIPPQTDDAHLRDFYKRLVEMHGKADTMQDQRGNPKPVRVNWLSNTLEAYISGRWQVVGTAEVLRVERRIEVHERDTGAHEGDNYTVKVSGDDTTPDFLEPKLEAGAGITLTVHNSGANEHVEVAATAVSDDDKVLVSSNDTTPDYLESKVTAGAGVTVTVHNEGGNEHLDVAATAVSDDDKVKVSTDDTTPGFLEDKLTVSGGGSLATANPAGNEVRQLTIHADETPGDTVPEVTVIGAVGTSESYRRDDTVPGMAPGTTPVIHLGQNMIKDGGFNIVQGTPAVMPWWGGEYGTGVTFARVTTDAYVGGACLQISRSGTATGGIIYQPRNEDGAEEYLAVSAGRLYRVWLAAHRSGALKGNRVQMVVHCYTRAKVFISSLTPIDLNPPDATWNGSSATVGTGALAWPSGTTYCRIEVRDVSSNAAAVNLVGCVIFFALGEEGVADAEVVPHNLLSPEHEDTTVGACTPGAMIAGHSDSTWKTISGPTLAGMVPTAFTTPASGVAWSAIYPAVIFKDGTGATLTKGDTFYANATPLGAILGIGTTPALKYVSSSGLPAWGSAGTALNGAVPRLKAGVPTWGVSLESICDQMLDLVLTNALTSKTSVQADVTFSLTNAAAANLSVTQRVGAGWDITGHATYIHTDTIADTIQIVFVGTKLVCWCDTAHNAFPLTDKKCTVALDGVAQTAWNQQTDASYTLSGLSYGVHVVVFTASHAGGAGTDGMLVGEMVVTQYQYQGVGVSGDTVVLEYVSPWLYATTVGTSATDSAGVYPAAIYGETILPRLPASTNMANDRYCTRAALDIDQGAAVSYAFVRMPITLPFFGSGIAAGAATPYNPYARPGITVALGAGGATRGCRAAGVYWLGYGRALVTTQIHACFQAHIGRVTAIGAGSVLTVGDLVLVITWDGTTATGTANRAFCRLDVDNAVDFFKIPASLF